MDAQHLESLVPGQVGEDPRQTRGEHRLARARCAHQQQVVSTGGGDLEGAAGHHLTADVEEVGLARTRNRRDGALDIGPRPPTP